MNKVLLYSINPEHLANILNGHKTIEVRKRDLPQWAKDKLARGEKVIGYGYETLGKQRKVTWKTWENYADYYGVDIYDEKGYTTITQGRGLVVVKFEVSGSEFIDMQKRKRRDVDTTTKLADGTIHRLVIDFVLEYKYDNPEGACLTDDELHLYGNGKDLYAHHLTNITPIEPMEVGEFQTRYLIEETLKWYGEFDYVYQPLTKSPQSFMTCWVKGE